MQRQKYPTNALGMNTDTVLFLFGILLLQSLRDGLQLDVARALVDGSDLAVTEHLLSDALSHKAHAAHPLDGQAGDTAGNLRGIKLGHGGIHDEVLASLLLASGVEDEGAGSGDFGVGLRDLVLHALEIANELTELLAVVPDVSEQRPSALSHVGMKEH